MALAPERTKHPVPSQHSVILEECTGTDFIIAFNGNNAEAEALRNGINRITGWRERLERKGSRAGMAFAFGTECQEM